MHGKKRLASSLILPEGAKLDLVLCLFFSGSILDRQILSLCGWRKWNLSKQSKLIRKDADLLLNLCRDALPEPFSNPIQTGLSNCTHFIEEQESKFRVKLPVSRIRRRVWAIWWVLFAGTEGFLLRSTVFRVTVPGTLHRVQCAFLYSILLKLTKS